jgi:hypothetical protein
MSKTELLARLHFFVSESFDCHLDGFWSDRDESIISAVLNAVQFANDDGFDLHQIILEKVEYNRHRADHKRENREKEGGKKY